MQRPSDFDDSSKRFQSPKRRVRGEDVSYECDDSGELSPSPPAFPRFAADQPKQRPTPGADVSYECDESGELSLSPLAQIAFPRFAADQQKQRPMPGADVSYECDESELSLSSLGLARFAANQSIHPDRPQASETPPRAAAESQPTAAPEAPAKDKRWSVKRMFTERFKRDKPQQQGISYEEALEQAARYQECQNHWADLVAIIKQYDRRFGWELQDNPSLIVKKIRQIIERLDIAKRQVTIHLDWVHGLPGTKLSYEVKKVENRIQELFEDYNTLNSMLITEVREKDDEILRLQAESAKDKKLVQQCNYGKLSVNKATVANLRANIVGSEVQRENLQKQVDSLRWTNANLHTQTLQLRQEVANLKTTALRKYSEAVKEIQIWSNEELYKYVMEHLKAYEKDKKEPDHADAVHLIEALSAAFTNVRDKIDEMRDTAKFLEENYAERFADVQSLTHQVENLSLEASVLEEIAASREEQNRSRREELSKSYVEFVSGATTTSSPKTAEQWWGSPERPRIGSPRVPYERDFIDAHSMSLEDSGSDPIIIPSLTVTPPSPLRSPHMFSSSTRSNLVGPGAQAFSPPQSRIIIDPLNETMMPIPMGPEIEVLSDPSPQRISGVTNRLEVGRDFNMHTVHSGSPAPYQQVTRVDSVISPQPGPSRMLDSPLHVQHRANVAPPGYKTPWISTQSRYGYTDPSYRMLNIPPGGFIEMNTALKKKLMLMSPQREEPLLVNIGVDPKPLVQTESGEHFICDISLDVQQASKTKPPLPPLTRSEKRRQGLYTPPGIYDKRHYNIRWLDDEYEDSPGRYFPPHYLPHDGRSPVSHLSPVSLLSDGTISWERIPGVERIPSPVIRPSWAYPGYIPSPLTESSVEESPVIRGIIDINSTDFSDSSFERTPPSQRSPSPVIRGLVDTSSSPSTGRSFERSPSPVIRGIVDTSSSLSTDRSFERSPSPVIRGIVDMSSSPSTYSNFERSPSPLSPSSLMYGSFDRSQTPRLDGSIDPLNRVGQFRVDSRGNLDMISPPSTDESFERSASPQIYGTFERIPSPMTDRSSDRSLSPRLDSSFSRSPSPLSRVHRFRDDGRGYLDMSSSLSPDGSFDRSSSPRFDGSFPRSPSPLSRVHRFGDDGRGNLGMSSSLSPDGSFDRSSSPRLDGSFPRSPSPLSRVHRFTNDGQGYLDMSSPNASPVSARTFDSSGQSNPLYTTYDSHAGRFTPNDQFAYGPSDRSYSPSMSPRSVYSDWSASSGYDNPFNPNNSGLSPSSLTPHILNTSMPPRLGGVFNENPSRLTRTI